MLRLRKDPARLVLLVIVWMTAFAKGLAAAEPEDRPRLIRADTRDRIPGQYIVILDDETLPGDSVPTPTEMAARAAYETAGVAPSDIDLAEVQDTDAAREVLSVEELAVPRTAHIDSSAYANLSPKLS